MLMFAGMSLSFAAGEFAPPAEGPVPFRRDKIPLDAVEMSEISTHLEALARGLQKETPATYRGAAQMLALAMAVDPGNNAARELVAQYQNDQLRTDENQERLKRARDKISALLPWLDSEEAGKHGRALAACLKDVLTISDPDESFTGETNSLGSWTGWIPDISAYEPKVVTNQDPTPTPEPKDPSKKEILLNEAQIQTVLWKNIGEGNAENWVITQAPLQMSVRKMETRTTRRGREIEVPFSILIGSAEDDSLSNLSQMVCNLLLSHHGSLPAGYQIQINSKELEHSLQSGKRHSLSAAVAVLANSALSGTVPDAIVIGQIDETGAFKLPSGFWNQLRGLGKGSGKRLVLPADAASYLPSILAFEKPDFFIEYEVLLASNFSQLLDLTSKTPAESLVAQMTKFRQIRETVGTQDIRQHILNRFVKQRLAEIMKELPCHYSAQMLLLQSAGKRPTTIIRPVLISELIACLDPMEWIAVISMEVATSRINKDDSPVGIPFRGQDVEKFNAVYEQSRKRVDELERLTTKDDLPLLEQARKVSVSLRTLDRTLRSRNSFASYNQPVVAANRRAAREFADLLRQTMKQFANEAGAP